MTVDLDRVRHALRRPPGKLHLPHVARAAVAAVILPDETLLFMRRAAFEGDPWSGHVAFPGGRTEPSDRSPLHTALRETREELGLDLREAELLGELDPIPTVHVTPQLVVHPFVFALRDEPELFPNGEVASVHRVPIALLLRGDGRGEMPLDWFGERVILPRVDVDGVRLWGLTLRMVDDLLDRLDGGGVGLARVPT